MKRFLTCGKTSRLNLTRLLLISSVVGLLAAGCTRLEIEDKAGAYNTAIGESNNRQILINAVRASQRAPMSFVAFGEIDATPTFNGSASGTWEFDPFGLTKTTAGSMLSAGGGFATFKMSNLNNGDYMEEMQTNVEWKLIKHFIDLKYPKELLQLVFVQEYTLPQTLYHKIVHDAESRCAHSPSSDFCERIAQDLAAYEEKRCRELERVEPGPTITIPNTGRHFCSMTRFQTFVRQLIVLNLDFKPPLLRYLVRRTPEGMLYWLGELIAAQNYSVDPYLPQTFANTHTPLGYKLVPLFEVRRGPPLLPPALAVAYHGEIFYIPRPDFGAIDEARSLEVLDLVWYAITLNTGKDFLPKSSTVTVANVK
jgi:hypothetical protein